jgi:hypothetical protein
LEIDLAFVRQLQIDGLQCFVETGSDQAPAALDVELRRMPGTDDPIAGAVQVRMPTPRECRTLMRAAIAIGEQLAAAAHDEQRIPAGTERVEAARTQATRALIEELS